MLNLSVVLEESARRFPDKDALVFGVSRMTYRELDQASSRVALGLEGLGVEPGDKVAISCPNLPTFPIVYYGILKARAVVVPLNVLLKGREIAYHLDDSEARIFLCFEGTPDLPMGEEGAAGFEAAAGCEHLIAITADPAAASPIPGATTLGELMAGVDPLEAASLSTAVTNPDDTAVILYTSGTTGRPKGAELTHSNLVMNTRGSADMLVYRSDDVALIVLPLFHSFGQVVQLNAGILVGMTLVLVPRFDPGTVLRAMEGVRGVGFLRRADHVLGAAHPPRQRGRSREDREEPAGLRLRRGRPPSRGAQGFRGQVRGADPRRLRPVRDLARGLFQPSGSGAQARLHRHPDLGHPDEGGERRGRGASDRRARRDPDPWPQRDEGLLPATRPPSRRSSPGAKSVWQPTNTRG